MPGSTSISGIVSGLRTDEIIAKIMEVERRPITRLQSGKQDYTTKLAAWQEFNTRLLALQVKASAIASPSQFDSRSASSSDTSILTAAAGPTADAGSYVVRVAAAAQSHQLASQGFTSVNDQVGVGTVNVSFADGTAFHIDIDDTNNSLSGLRDAINKSNAGVSAVTVNTGDLNAPYKLLLAAVETGTARAMTVDTSGLDNPDRPVIDQVVQAASDAVVEIGTGAGKISVTKSSNTITDVIPGVTLSIKSADASKTVLVEVQVDHAGMQQKIQDFVTQYNNIVDFLNSQFKYDSESNNIGVLFGDSRLQTIQSDLAKAVLSPLTGVSQEITALSQVGITMSAAGGLSIDTAKLEQAISGSLSQVRNLFSVGFGSTSPAISYSSSTTATKSSPLGGYEVVVTQAATQSRVTAGIAQSGALDQNESLTINGVTVVLEAGWSQDQVIAEINKHSRRTGVQASATGADGSGSGSYLTLTQVNYGSGFGLSARSSVSCMAGANTGLGNLEVSASDPLGESGLGSGAAGLDMVGSINGVQAAARGQYLTAQAGASGNPAEGLRLRIEATGPLTATVNFANGIGASVKNLLLSLTDAAGPVSVAQNTISETISDIDQRIADWETRLALREEKLYRQFNEMEDALARLQQQGQYLASLLGGLTNT